MHARARGSLLALAGLFALLAMASVVLAHSPGGAGHAVDVEPRVLPSWLGWAAGGLVVAVTFALVGVFLTQNEAPGRREASGVGAGDVTGVSRRVVGLTRLLGLVGFGVVVLAGLVPWNPGPGAERLVWIVVWAGLPMVAYFVGNVWVFVSPFRALAGFAERLRGGYPAFEYPERLGAWPSVALVVGVVVFEGLRPGSVWVGRVALLYALFTVVGMATFGSRVWLERVEVFDRFFAWWSLAAPARLGEGGWSWGWPGRALSSSSGAGWADAVFLVAVLFGTKAEGFLGTGVGAWLVSVGGVGLGVLVGSSLFVGVFVGAVLLGEAWASPVGGPGWLAGVLAVALVPIAVGYHAAHNVPFVVENVPLVVEAVRDPLALAGAGGAVGLGLGRFGDALVLFQVGVIVSGHVLGVVVGHRRAFGAFASRVQAVKVEVPLTGAMVGFTLTSLWIVSVAYAGGVV